ncbi:family 20 glycosylhydrolase [Chitinophaga sp.]|uniref:family 20 glycosylhydrolase n=1 Tax=Chitinophaga sp. TaxID=1869181 RepID=UPI0026171EF4|nr:family 20 glycosylhydrolase [uncultured Chitinophaga sp.]
MRNKLIIVCLLLSCCAMAQSPAFPAKGLQMRWEVVENGYQGKAQTLSTFTLVNRTKQALPANGWTIYYNFIRMVSPGEVAPGIEAAHINGDLFRLKPVAGFGGLKPGDSLKINIVSVAWVTHFTDAPAGPYIVWDNQPSKGHAIEFAVTPSTQEKQLRRTAKDTKVQTTPEDVYRRNEALSLLPADQLPRILPTPALIRESGATVVLDPKNGIVYEPVFRAEADYLSLLMGKVFGKPVLTAQGTTGKAAVRLVKDTSITGKEAYKLQVQEDGITIFASTNTGIFYGIQSLRQLLPLTAKGTATLPAVQVEDAPRFAFRSFSLDVARNFHSKAQVLRMLDVMAVYKVNTLHLHMSDDEGWRVEIAGLPELTQVGGRRAHTLDEMESLQPAYGSGPDAGNTAGTGWYTRADYIEILRYAKARHIKVIPEVEMPGHGRAAIKAMEARAAKLAKAGDPNANEYRLSDPEDKSQYRSVQEWKDNVMNPALPSTYKFIEKVTTELAAMHAEAGVPLDIIHMGGDETPGGVWEKSPACQKLLAESAELNHVDDLWIYFYDKVARIVNKQGMQLYGWEEAGMRRTQLDGNNVMIVNPVFGNRNFQLDVWNNVMGGGMEDLSYRLANGGYKVVLSGVANYYFDMAYQRDYDEPGFYWGGYVDLDKPFYFIPLDLYKNAKEDDAGNPLPASIFVGKDRLTAYGASNIVGIQCALWSETVKSPERLEYMVLPKLLGMAERAWAPDPAWTKDLGQYNEAWNKFANVVGQREIPRLATLNGGYNYRIPTAGVKNDNGKVLANVQLPGLIIRYTTDGKEPSAKSPVYSGPLEAKGIFRFRVFDQAGRGGRTVTVQY